MLSLVLAMQASWGTIYPPNSHADGGISNTSISHEVLRSVLTRHSLLLSEHAEGGEAELPRECPKFQEGKVTLTKGHITLRPAI